MRTITVGEAPGAVCSIATGESLENAPIWSILEVAAGPDLDGCLPDEEVTGCSDPLHFGDQMLFGATSLRLRSVRLRVPEQNARIELAGTWKQAPALAGIPRLSTPVVFALPSAVARVFDPHDDALLSLSETSDPSDAMRLSVSEDLDLLFADGAHVGFMLRRASTHLISPLTGSPPIRPVIPDASSLALLAEFLQLVDDDLVSALQDQDPAARGKIVQFRDRANHRTDGISEILASWIDDILERF